MLPLFGFSQSSASTGVPLSTISLKTVIPNSSGIPKQTIPLFSYTGVTVISADSETADEFVAIKLGISPSPLASNPIIVLLLVQVYVVFPSVFCVEN